MRKGEGNEAAKAVAKVALAAHNRIDLLEKRIRDLEARMDLVVDWKPKEGF